jgi:hypothetical protein
MEYDPAGVDGVVERVNVDEPEPPRGIVTGLGLKEAVRPGTFEGRLAVRESVPWRQALLSVTVDTVGLPATTTLGEEGEAVMPKLPVIVKVTLAVCTTEPAVPVMVTV